ncbi:hypothetical protein [sulfur-oxidizing endosymbiont of Gigantopelta aegis]|uniref:hypothetical protein n=1 Tax=sulfur-oxidizing endosymbiont of Gigantopelta aegis TaxID=2794934 RepID=UPI0018DD9030|nr:hypothetical protein [sulfur-oxidizing endosymbiont of Gigantopelta aegis]
MSDKNLEQRVQQIRKQLEEHPDQYVEITHEEAEYMGAFEDDSMSMEDALESHNFDTQSDSEGQSIKTKPRVVDAAETASKGEFLDIPAYVCRGIKQ